MRTIDDLFIQYEKIRLPHLAESTQRSRKGHMALILNMLPSKLPVASFSRVWAEQLRTKLCEGRENSTVNTIMSSLHAILEWGVEVEFVALNRMDGMRALRVPKKAIRVLTKEEEAKLLYEAANVNAATFNLIMAGMYTGFRRGTLTQLTWDDVDLSTGMWCIPASKTKTRTRLDVPVHPKLLELLKVPPKGERIFTDVSARTWKKVVKFAGLPGLKFHDLRRNFVTRCRRADVPVEVACALGGWANFQIVMNVYRAVSEEDMRLGIKAAFGEEE